MAWPREGWGGGEELSASPPDVYHLLNDADAGWFSVGGTILGKGRGWGTEFYSIVGATVTKIQVK